MFCRCIWHQLLCSRRAFACLTREQRPLQTSAKTGLGIESVLPAVIERIPPYVPFASLLSFHNHVLSFVSCLIYSASSSRTATAHHGSRVKRGNVTEQLSLIRFSFVYSTGRQGRGMRPSKRSCSIPGTTSSGASSAWWRSSTAFFAKVPLFLSLPAPRSFEAPCCPALRRYVFCGDVGF